jgi:hypothetical protein
LFIISLFTDQHVSNAKQSNAKQNNAKQSSSLHKDTTPPQPNHNVTPTHIEPEQHNT